MFLTLNLYICQDDRRFTGSTGFNQKPFILVFDTWPPCLCSGMALPLELVPIFVVGWHISCFIPCTIGSPASPHVDGCSASAFLTSCIIENGAPPWFLQTLIHLLTGRIGSQWARQGCNIAFFIRMLWYCRGHVLDLNHTSRISMIFTH